MPQVLQREGTLKSGDVNLYFRHFGKGGGIPLLMQHGAHYFDSVDWIDVCRSLAEDREVVICDNRGYARSDWSPEKDYSVDAALKDANNILDHFGFERAVIAGHSRGGGLAILFGAHFPRRTAAVVAIDRPLHKPVGRSHLQKGVPKTGNEFKVYASLEEAVADMGRDVPIPISNHDKSRLLEFLKPYKQGFAITGRDPDRTNTVPLSATNWRSVYEHEDLWDALSKISAPTLIVRGSRSDRYPPEVLSRLASEFSHIRRVDVPAAHDVAAGAPRELVAAIQKFLADVSDRI